MVHSSSLFVFLLNYFEIAQPFAVVQKRVAISIKDNILVGHALSNDLKALLLSHPGPMTRDTQYYAHKFKVCKSNRVALRDLVKQELGLIIQSGEHSSVCPLYSPYATIVDQNEGNGCASRNGSLPASSEGMGKGHSASCQCTEVARPAESKVTGSKNTETK